MDTFEIAVGDLGELTKVQLRSDDTGVSADWHVDKVIIEDPTGKKYNFPANVWLASDPGKALTVSLIKGEKNLF